MYPDTTSENPTDNSFFPLDTTSENHFSMEDNFSVDTTTEPSDPKTETAAAYIQKQLNTFEAKVIAPIALLLACTIYAFYTYCQRRKQNNLYEQLLFEAEDEI